MKINVKIKTNSGVKMGREQELRDAAKEGNLVKLETLLSVKKSALMSR